MRLCGEEGGEGGRGKEASCCFLGMGINNGVCSLISVILCAARKKRDEGFLL